MPSPKGYNREEVLDLAIELFRRQGYSATSTAELVAELGMNRKSMYAEFGSKQELFEAVLEHYDRKHLTRMLADIELDGIDIQGKRMAESFEAVLELFTGRAAVTDDIKMFT